MGLDELYKEYEGCVVHNRGVRDELVKIVNTLSSRLPLNNEKLNNFLCSMFSIYSFIKEISIEGNDCFIKYLYEGCIRKVSFSSLYYGDNYKKVLYSYNNLTKQPKNSPIF